ncbi:MAG: acyltransferase family protein [Polaromonas sp.]|uniref:acyltransferase family protein n=1 Tax=Polaromonas sp. TaxID=1869339 RepID=UPI0024891CD5|nr:acyltransferase family protein [Polaromonas sp.]MDI1270406.1 acyltransferase family protein [Polaromonas sp.]
MLTPTHAPQEADMAYRPDIDGLRALAVLAVVAFHAFPERLPGGFVGVDVFFVISGFLISSIIMRGIEGGTFSYRDFYARRIRRIFPALIFVLLVTLGLGLTLLLPDQNLPLGKEVMAGALFFYNFLVLRTTDYFDTAAAQNTLLHLWSLGVEEQFYMLWPVALVLVWRLKRHRSVVIAALALASFLLNIVLVETHPSAAFYLPFTRFWQLLCGALLAMAALQSNPILQSPQGSRPLRQIVSLAGMALIVVSIAVVTDGVAYPGWPAIMPTLGAVLLIAAGPGAWINRHLLSQPSVVFIGLVSYPLYLWHWPALHWAPLIAKRVDLLALHTLIVDALEFAGSDNSRKVAGWVIQRGPKMAALLVAFALAVFTYLVIEKRVRTSPNRSRTTRSLFIALVIGIPVLAGAQMAFMQYKMNGAGRGEFFKRYDMSSPNSAYRRTTVAAYRTDCSVYGGPGDVKPTLDAPCIVPAGSPIVLLWGDSHAMHLRPGLDALQRRRQSNGKSLNILQVTSGSCHAAIEQTDRTTEEARGCNLANELALQTIAKVKPDVVIITQAIGHASTNWPDLVAEVSRRGAKHVIVVGPVPQWTESLPQLVAYRYWPAPPARLQDHLQPEMFAVDRQLRRDIINTPTTSYVSAIDFFCDQNRACLVSLGPDRLDLTTHDSGHLTPATSRAFAEGKLGAAIAAFIDN